MGERGFSPEDESIEPGQGEFFNAIKELYGEVFDEETMLSLEEEFAQSDKEDALGYFWTVALENGLDEEEVTKELLKRGLIQ